MDPVETLIAATGTWQGTNTLRDPTTGKPEESSTTATVTPTQGGRFVRLDYTWGRRGKPQEGSLLIGFDPQAGVVSGYWVDTWHMGRKGMACLGTAAEGLISVRGSFAAPPGPDWGWRIDLAADPLRITHTIIDPDGREDRAADGVYAPGVRFRAAGPIGATDTRALPVREIGPAVGYYARCLGFAPVAQDGTTATLRRDEVEIGLAVNGRDPEQASCWFAVGDVDALRREYEARGIAPGPIHRQERDGKAYRVFFANDCSGVCFCFTQPAG